MTQETIKRLHELEEKRDSLIAHIDTLPISWDPVPERIGSKLFVKFAFGDDDNRHTNYTESELYFQFLPYDILNTYLANARKRLAKIEKRLKNYDTRTGTKDSGHKCN